LTILRKIYSGLTASSAKSVKESTISSILQNLLKIC